MIEENSLDALSEELANTLYCLENLEWSSNEPICVVQECTPLQYDQVHLSNIMFQIVFKYKFSCYSKKYYQYCLHQHHKNYIFQKVFT